MKKNTLLTVLIGASALATIVYVTYMLTPIALPSNEYQYWVNMCGETRCY